jgi:hypothetical protein
MGGVDFLEGGLLRPVTREAFSATPALFGLQQVLMSKDA